MAARNILCLILAFTLAGCVNFHVGTIPQPEPNAKLRVYVQPLSHADRGKGFGMPHAVFAAKQYAAVRRYLEETGIYEVVRKEDVAAVVGEQKLTRDLLRSSDWELARKIGRAVYAEYVMIVERGKVRAELGTTSFVFTTIMINTRTGKKFGARYEVKRNLSADEQERRHIIDQSYREIFRSAKQDMLETALRKVEALPEVKAAPAPAAKAETKAPVIEEQKKTVDAAPVPTPGSTAEEKQATAEAEAGSEDDHHQPVEETPAFITTVKDPEGLTDNAAGQGATRLVVYDFDAPELYKPAALIISDALREEIFRLKNFVLVNRENMNQVLQEMALQQTGLVDDKDAVKMGKGLAASQVVTGRLGLLGKTMFMQAKRVDVETFATLGLASEKSPKDREEDIMEKLPAFARQLTSGASKK